MASNFEECPTGILVDYIGNTTISISLDSYTEKDLEEDLNDKDAVLAKPSHGAEKLPFDCETPFVSIGVHNIPSSRSLGTELNRKKDEVCFVKTGWRSPSPTSMNMITTEASRIIDQLQATLETSLWEEEFPLSSTSEDESFEYSSNESKEHSQNVILTKYCNIIGENPCFIKENSVEKSFFMLETPRVIDDIIIEESSDISKIGTLLENSNVKSLKENCKITEKHIENVVEMKSQDALASLRRNPFVTEYYTNTELSHAMPEESNLILEKGKASTKESCTLTEESCTMAKENCTLTEENFNIIKESWGPTTESFLLTEECCLLTEKCFAPTGESCAPTEESCASTEESCAPTEESCIPTEESCVLTEKRLAVTEEKCLAVKDSCIITQDNFNETKEIAKDAKIGIVAKDNFSECAKFSNSDANPVPNILIVEGYTSADVKQNHEFSKETPVAINAKCTENTPLSVKSKLIKIFKTPSFKTTIKYKKLEEKDNLMQKCNEKAVLEKNAKIGQVSSIKGILNASNSKGAVLSTSKSSIKTPLNKNIREKIPFEKENKPNVSVIKDKAIENLEKFDTPLKKKNILKFQPALSKKTPLFKSNSVVEAPNKANAIRRSSSFQTRQIQVPGQIRRERSFITESGPKKLNPRMSLIRTQEIGIELLTPSKIGSYLPKSSSSTFATPSSSNAKSFAKESQVARPSLGSALRQTQGLDENCPQVVDFKRPASTSSKSRFVRRLELPSPLPKMGNDNLSRRLFNENSTPLKRRI